MTKLIFFGCLSKKNYESTCQNAIRLIQFLDNEYQVHEEVPCCGSLLYHTSPKEEQIEHQQIVNNWFKEREVSEIVTICAGCYNYLSTYYKENLGDAFDIKIQHLLQFINKPENLKKLSLKFNGKKINIAYHDPCHLKCAVTPIIEEPRNIIASIGSNLKLKEMENNQLDSLCCGSGGGVYSIFKENSDFNTDLIFKQAKKVQAKVLLTPCPFCYTALKRIKEENKIRIPIMKFEDFIVKVMDGWDNV